MILKFFAQKILLATIVSLVGFCSSAMRAADSALSSTRVSDLIHAINPDSAARLQQELLNYEKTTGNVIAVTVVDSLTMPRHVSVVAENVLRSLHSAPRPTVVIAIQMLGENKRPEVFLLPAGQLAARFPRKFARNLCTDKVRGPIYDGHSVEYAIRNVLPYVKGVMEGTYTAEDYRVARTGKWWPWYICAGIALILVAILFPRRKKNT